MLFVLGCLIYISGCSLRERLKRWGILSDSTLASDSPEDAVDLAAGMNQEAEADFRWFVLRDGSLVETSQVVRTLSDGMEPWTSQERIEGFLRIDESLYFGINGIGIGSVHIDDLPGHDGIDLRVYRDACMFEGRTITGLYRAGSQPDVRRLYCSVYCNTIFPSLTACDRPVALVTLDAAHGILERVPIPFQETNPEWEAVDLYLSRDGNSWMIAWKSDIGGDGGETAGEEDIGGDGVAFRYSRHPLNGSEMVPVDRAGFVERYGYRDISRGPDCLRLFLPEQLRAGHTVHFTIHDTGSGRIRRFRYGPAPGRDSRKLYEITVWEEANRCIALLPDSRLRACLDGSSVDFVLPELPRGFVYTGFWSDARVAVIAWEERKFPDVGVAGIVVVIYAGIDGTY